MKFEILDRLTQGPATLGDLQRALGVPDSPSYRRGALLRQLEALFASGQILRPAVHKPWYALRKGSRDSRGRFAK